MIEHITIEGVLNEFIINYYRNIVRPRMYVVC